MEAPRPAGLAYVIFFFLGMLAINTFYLVFEQEERRFILWALLAVGFGVSFFAKRGSRILIHRFIDVASILTLIWFILAITQSTNYSRFGNFLGQMVCIFLVLFSFRSFRQSDFAWLMVIALVIMMLCSIPIYAASYIYSILGFLFLLACGLIVLNLYPGNPDHRQEEESVTTTEFGKQFGQMLMVSLGIMAFCWVIFAAVPQRIESRHRDMVRQIFGVENIGAETNSGFAPGEEEEELLSDDSDAGAYSGFSEQFDLAGGRSGAIREDRSEKIIVKGAGGHHLRAIAWDVYNGRAWERTSEPPNLRMTWDKQPDENIYAGDPKHWIRKPLFFKRYGISGGSEYSERLDELESVSKEAEITLVGSVRSKKGYLFSPWQSWRVEGEYFQVYYDDMGSFKIHTLEEVEGHVGPAQQDEYILSKGDTYSVWFQIKGQNEPMLDLPNLTPLLLDRYTQLPETTPARVTNLGASFAADGADSHAVVRRVRNYLQRQKQYSLDPPILPPTEACAVDYWLNQSEQGGHCELFSTSAAVLLRAAGVPCRVVTGYSPGTFSLAKNAWVIQGRDAHAWVEVFHNDVGWVVFDPTPSNWSEGLVEVVSDWTGKVSQTLEDYFIYNPQGFWRHDVPNYIERFQLWSAKSAQLTLAWGSQPVLGIPRGFLALFAGLFLTFIMVLLLTFRRYGVPFGDFQTLQQTRTRQWSLRQYTTMVRRLQRFDDTLPDGLTIPELADHLEEQRPTLAVAVSELEEPFGHFHYGAPAKRNGWTGSLHKAWRAVLRVLP